VSAAPWWDGAGDGALVAGAAMSLTSAVGLLRLPDVLTRMHAATKPQVLGLLLILLGAALRLRDADDVTTLVLVGMFQTWTVPVAAHMVARAAQQAGTGRAGADPEG
jgi:multicomponent Na+:H+ antiporter subunit G